ncbi:winged helix-turn-helix domain-containing protein [Granulicella tundricola]|uniref:Transcriptional regulator, CadC n=1 Tax=Granulicella tundricola (strain ATCC BAA-1859 / DSM 23138 / MP5ACTX9) TaxID=1198114 RepID=E8X6B9_GRATM|nr:winged helix-turn-helix domain-containing protein [Granulicella tundricola]ADW71003.1 transcriptional regulator, CadC [Granulicella tundricola MP5ACTX9]
MAAIVPGSGNSPSGTASEGAAEGPARGGRRILFGDFEAQPAAGLLLRNGHRVRIQDLPFRMLMVLLETPGEIVTREELRNRLWGEKTFVEFDNNLRVAAAKLREALQDSAAGPRYLETVARRGYRFLGAVETIAAAVPVPEAEVPEPPRVDVLPDIDATTQVPLDEGRGRRPFALLGLAAVLLVGLAVWMAWGWRHHRPILAEGDTVALGSIENETGDASLDDALSLAFRIKMEESPFLHAISGEHFERASAVLQSGKGAKLSRAAAELSVCGSSGGRALLNGRLLRSGSGYTVRLAAERCTDGREIASTEASTNSAETLLAALGDAANAIRLRLGEPTATLGRFDVPLTQATTSSLAALRAFREGEQKHFAGRDLEAREDFKLAIDLDPNFALAYLQMGRSYSNNGERSLSRAYYQKAFDLRDRTTDREKLYIATSYYGYATGELGRAISAYELWSSLYPHDVVPANNLATEYLSLGEGQKAVASVRRAIALEPALPVPYTTLAQALLISGDLPALSTLCNDRQREESTSMGFHMACHELAIVQGDQGRQQSEERFVHGTPLESLLLNDAAEAEVYGGHLRRAAEMFQGAIDAARAHAMPELASVIELNGAGIFAELGESATAVRWAEDEQAHSQPGADLDASAAMVWATLGNESRAREFAAAAKALSPTDTLLNESELPVAYAIVALHAGRPRDAVAVLAPARPYDLNNSMELMPIYYRARALLASGDRAGAAAEFERLLANAHQRPRSVYLPLSRLALVKLYAAGGQAERARAMKESLEEIWRTADPNFAPLHSLRGSVSDHDDHR